MKKIVTGLLCVIIAIIVAVSMTGCKNGSDELTYSNDPQQSSSNTQASSDSKPAGTDNSENPETVVYQLTTRQGETVQVLSTTVPVTEFSTVNYDPVSVPPMNTTVYGTTTEYQPPTYTPDASNQVTTKPSTTESTTEKKTSYASVEGTAGIEGEKMFVDVQLDEGDFENKFGKLEEKKGSATLTCDGEEYKTNCSVKSTLVGGEARIYIDIPSELAKLIDSDEDYTISIFIPKGTIVGSKGVENKAFYTIL